MRLEYLVSYDVRDEKRMRRTAKTLEGYGLRLQYSVFRCVLSERDLERLRWELSRILEPEDGLLMIGLCRQCVQRIRCLSPERHWPKEEVTHVVI